MVNEKEVVGRLLACAIKMEYLVANLYENLSAVFGQPYSLALRHIAKESLNHALTYKMVLEEILKMRMPQVNTCVELGGDAYKVLVEVTQKANKNKLDFKEALDLFERANELENLIGEEMYTRMILPAVRELVNKEGFKIIETLINEIIEEEKYHSLLVSDMIEALRKQIAE